MYRTLLAASMGACLLGCGAIGSQTQSPNGLVVATNRTFDGRPFSAVVMRYGPPSSHLSQGGLSIYHFYAPTSAHESVQATPVAKAHNAAYVDQPATSHSHDSSPHLPCTMRVRVGVNDTVQLIDFIGQSESCTIFMP